MKRDYFQEGQEAYHAMRDSPIFRAYTAAPPEAIMRLFLPPEDETLMQVSRPMSKSRQEWLKGFNAARNGHA